MYTLIAWVETIGLCLILTLAILFLITATLILLTALTLCH